MELEEKTSVYVEPNGAGSWKNRSNVPRAGNFEIKHFLKFFENAEILCSKVVTKIRIKVCFFYESLATSLCVEKG